jgi:hypothetical protein
VVALVLGVLVSACSSEPREMHTGMSSVAASYDSLCSKGDDGPSAVVCKRACIFSSCFVQLQPFHLSPYCRYDMMRYVIIQVRQRAERAFARYAELHRAILDPKVTGNISMHTDKQLETISRERERQRETQRERERDRDRDRDRDRERDRERQRDCFICIRTHCNPTTCTHNI